MNIEDRIPAPRITYPNKVALKRRPIIKKLISTAAAAIVVCTLGLGYFFCQWSAPPTQDDIILTNIESVIAEPKQSEEPPSEEHSESANLPKLPEQSTPRPLIPSTPKPIEVTDFVEDVMLVEQQVIAYTPVVVNNDIVRVTIEVEAVKISLPMEVVVEPPLIDELQPEKKRILGGVFDNLKPTGDLREYGKEIKESIQNIPQRLAMMKEDANKPFRKIIKEEEI